MKNVEDVVACCVDYGTFVSVAEKLGETMRLVYYHSPYETEYQDVRDCVIGQGLPNVQRLDELMDPEYIARIDLFVFPDIGFGALQRYLRSIGKAVWGHMGANDLELFRTDFLQVLQDVGLPVAPSLTIVGVTALAKYLKQHDNKWVKINRFRGNVETFHHLDYAHSVRTLDSLAVIFGGYKEQVIFVVQDEIETDSEVGYDGWCIDGKFPPFSFQGYEAKNELYLGSLLAAEDLPDEIKQVNEAMAPILASYGYRDWWATEIRISDGEPYFIDPTPRLPGQTGEHQLESCANLAEVIWYGAHGIVVPPKFIWNFAAEATLHYESATKDPSISDEWKSLELPKDLLPRLKLYRYCIIDGVHQFSSKNTNEVGVVLGFGDDVESSIADLTANLEQLKGLPVHANTAGFAKLLESIHEAEAQGIEFGGDPPEPAEIIETIS